MTKNRAYKTLHKLASLNHNTLLASKSRGLEREKNLSFFDSKYQLLKVALVKENQQKFFSNQKGDNCLVKRNKLFFNYLPYRSSLIIAAWVAGYVIITHLQGKGHFFNKEMYSSANRQMIFVKLFISNLYNIYYSTLSYLVAQSYIASHYITPQLKNALTVAKEYYNELPNCDLYYITSNSNLKGNIEFDALEKSTAALCTKPLVALSYDNPKVLLSIYITVCLISGMAINRKIKSVCELMPFVMQSIGITSLFVQLPKWISQKVSLQNIIPSPINFGSEPPGINIMNMIMSSEKYGTSLTI